MALLVEAAGVEPASENIPLQFLRAYTLIWISPPKTPGVRIDQALSRNFFAPPPPGMREQLSCLNDALI